MAKGKKYGPEQIVSMLRQIEVGTAMSAGVKIGHRTARIAPRCGGVKADHRRILVS
jgi:hypothetical protein